LGDCALAADGRRIVYESWGDPAGAPVFLLHGTPGCRWGPRVRDRELRLMGVRLIAYDRPGYGCSDRHARRRVVDAARDVAAVADVLGLDRFAVVGRSGGGPHALACAAVLCERVTACAALVSFAPRDGRGLDWLDGMVALNRESFASYEGPLARYLATHTDALRDRAYLDQVLTPQASSADRAILADPAIRSLMDENFGRAAHDRALVSAGDGSGHVVAGWLDDLLAIAKPWGFELDAIDQPVLLWHGEEDGFAPVAHARWLGARIRKAQLAVEPGAAHFTALVRLREVLLWLRSRTSRSMPPPPVRSGAAPGHG
jgi:pimeloyl-ACP methyl ester carboxylesterase